MSDLIDSIGFYRFAMVVTTVIWVVPVSIFVYHWRSLREIFREERERLRAKAAARRDRRTAAAR